MTEREDDGEHRCPRCGSTRWVSVSLDEGYTRRAQCIPCGHVHAKLGPGWKLGG
jgi:rubredoxin